MRNPPWIRDELILCLDSYLKLKPKVPDPRLKEVKELSELLQVLGTRLSIESLREMIADNVVS